eukprot:TRINITY_DN7289_c0_g1_i1.p1 TRINITY_DN7289_c0_g1~~TRINITY_DN7289_c0_g1_i1.p1  ORF type:complete len:405 (+),score=114.15 TRINITY_DN7289_c0_g1_i1:33-1217(+)
MSFSSDPTGAADYIQTLAVTTGTEDGDVFTAIAEMHQRKLWHQLTVKLERYLESSVASTTPPPVPLREIYTNFIAKFELKLNSLRWVHMVVLIADTIEDANERLVFLGEILDKTKKYGHKEETRVYVQSRIALLQLQVGDVTSCKTHLEECKELLAPLTGIDSSCYSAFYLASAEYHKVKGPPASFYTNALMYLVYEPLDAIPIEKQKIFAFDLCIAALVGENIYNFGELLSHDILKALVDTPFEWMIQFLTAFNNGDLDQYEELVAKYSQKLEAQPALVANKLLLKEKIAVLCLMELIWVRAAKDRSLPFADIAKATKLALDEVELLLMKALSLKLVRGEIDQVEQFMHVEWVQPRVLGTEQVGVMRDRIKEWTETVHQAINLMEGETPELFA